MILNFDELFWRMNCDIDNPLVREKLEKRAAIVSIWDNVWIMNASSRSQNDPAAIPILTKREDDQLEDDSILKTEYADNSPGFLSPRFKKINAIIVNRIYTRAKL